MPVSARISNVNIAMLAAGAWSRAALCAVLCAAGTPVHPAPMYQWVDPQTGTVQLAGQPPPWFRRGEPGPRVRVFEHGKVIDDTAYAPAPTTPAPLAPASAAESAAPTGSGAMHALPAADPAPAQVEEFKALLEAWDREQAGRALQARPAPGTPSAVAAPPPH